MGDKQEFCEGGKGNSSWFRMPIFFEGTACNTHLLNELSMCANGLKSAFRAMVTVWVPPYRIGTSLKFLPMNPLGMLSDWKWRVCIIKKPTKSASKDQKSIRKTLKYESYAFLSNPLETGSTFSLGGFGFTTGGETTYLITDKILTQIINFLN